MTGVNNNRIDGWSYDAAGNLLYDQINHYTYDAENRIATLNGEPAYIYDAEGRRVAKTNSSGAATDIYILGLGGEEVTDWNFTNGWMYSNVYAGGRLLATYAAAQGWPQGYYFTLTDWLGTKRVQTDASGNNPTDCYSYPFGDGLQCTGNEDFNELHFTGKQHDTESGLEYFGARYLTSDLGRFMTPDVGSDLDALPYATLEDPQSLNLYSYVQNNPVNSVDADGRDVTVCSFVTNDNGSITETCNTISDDAYQAAVTAQQAANANNSPYSGIQSPGGDRPNGFITCSGQICGTATWSPTQASQGPDQGQVIPGDLGLSLFALRGPVGLAVNMAQTVIGLASQNSGSQNSVPINSSPMVGTKRSPMDVPRGTNEGTTIGGRYYSGHALDEMQSSGYVPSVVEDAIATGSPSPGNEAGTTVYTNDQARVVVNNRGGVITVMPQSK